MYECNVQYILIAQALHVDNSKITQRQCLYSQCVDTVLYQTSIFPTAIYQNSKYQIYL